MSSKRQTPFQLSHQLEYGLKMVEKAPSSSEIVSVSCRFCISFGREEKIGSKRKATTNVMYFKKPFRSDSYRRHMETQHPERWKQYTSCNNESKAKFFENHCPVPFKETIPSHFPGRQVPIVHTVGKDIVDVIVGDMMFDPEEEDSSSERALSIFEVDPDTP